MPTELIAKIYTRFRADCICLLIFLLLNTNKIKHAKIVNHITQPGHRDIAGDTGKPAWRLCPTSQMPWDVHVPAGNTQFAL